MYFRFKIYFLPLPKQLALLLFCLAFFAGQVAAQQGWERIYGGQYSEANSVLTAFDGNMIVTGLDLGGLGDQPNEIASYVIKMNQYGDRIWQTTFFTTATDLELVKGSNDAYLAVRNDTFVVNGQQHQKPIAFKLDDNGNIIWETVIQQNLPMHVTARELVAHSDGSLAFVVTEGTAADSQKYFTKIDDLGNLVAYVPIAMDPLKNNLIANPIGGYFHTTFENFGYLEIVALDALGNKTGSQTFSDVLEQGHKPFLMPNGDWIIFQYINGDIYQTTIKAGTNAVSSMLVVPNGANADDYIDVGDGFLLSGLDHSQASGLFAALMVRTDYEGNVLWEKRHNHLPGAQYLRGATRLANGDFVAAGYFGGPSGNDSYVLRTNDLGDIYTNSITGTVSMDANENCLHDGGEAPIEDWVVAAKKGEQVFVSLTNNNGHYVLPLDTGNYQITVYPVSNLWTPCTNDINIDLPVFDMDTSLNFPIQPVVICPSINVSNITPVLVPCEERPEYIYYCNNGTDTAVDAYIDISYDSLITPITSSIPFTALADNTYRFEVGDLDPLECGEISVTLALSCDAVLGASYCIETHAYPDSICLPDTIGWSGAFLQASGFCEGNDVFLRIQNVGESDMTDYSGYIVIEDILYFPYDSVNLDKGEQLDIPLPANGSTYTLLVEQVAGAPGFSYPIAVVEGCGVDQAGDFSIGFTNQFPLDDVNPFLDYDCPVATSFGSSNGMSVAPQGYEADNLITAETRIEYLIHFQNLDSDTISTVVIRDTLDSSFDLASLKMGASSHPYDVEMEGERILKITFQNIDLPNAAVDQLASFGFVEFKIAPAATTPLGTRISNKVGIYLDLEAPIVIDEVFHTIGGTFVQIITSTTYHPIIPNIEVKIFPNPFFEQCNIEILNHQAAQYSLEIFNSQGQLVRSENLNGHDLIFAKKNLGPGVYFYRLSAKDGFIHSGQLQVQ